MKAYEDFAAGPLEFPIGGKTYTVPEINYLDGMKLQEIEAGTLEAEGAEQWRLLMGTAYDEMVADNAPIKAIGRACLTCLTDYRTGNRELAEKVWESGILPELLAAQEAATETETPATDEATSTPAPDSTSGTTTRPRRTAKKTAARSSAS